MAEATAYSVETGWYDSFLLFSFGVETAAEGAGAAIADRLPGGHGDGLPCRGVHGGVLGADVHGEDSKAGHFDAVGVDELQGEFLDETGIDRAAFADGQAEVF